MLSLRVGVAMSNFYILLCLLWGDGNVTSTSVTGKYSWDLLLVFNVQQLLPLLVLVALFMSCM